MDCITYQSPTGATLNICTECEKRLDGQPWPKDNTGQEYCTVSHGLHQGVCDLCNPES